MNCSNCGSDLREQDLDTDDLCPDCAAKERKAVGKVMSLL